MTLEKFLIKDQLSQIILEEDDIVDILMTDPAYKLTKGLVKDINLPKIKELFDNLDNLIEYQPLDIDISTFDHQNQSIWYMPDEYKSLDIASWVLTQCTKQEPLQRCGQELLLFQDRNLFNLLRYLKYLVDVMKENNVIWGVGRGSSVASYVLYLIGVHKIDSMYYDLSISEFLR